MVGYSELAASDYASRTALNNSAVFISSTQCGPAGPPNNVYGWGRVDIAAAVGDATSTPNAYYANSNCYAFGVRRNSNAYADANGDTYSYAPRDIHGYRDGYDHCNAQTDAYAEICADTEASSHTSAKT